MTRLVAALLLGFAALTVGAGPAECVWCSSTVCYGPCGPPCVCLTPPGELQGTCYGAQAVPGLVGRGWRVVP